MDPVNHPGHYTAGGIECIEAIKASMPAGEFAGYLKGNCMKYLWRYQNKGGLESLQKCEWYLKRLITEVKRPQPDITADLAAAVAAEAANSAPAARRQKAGIEDET